MADPINTASYEVMCSVAPWTFDLDGQKLSPAKLKYAVDLTDAFKRYCVHARISLSDKIRDG